MNKLYVGNLAWAASEDKLKELFSQYGKVHSASIITDRETGRSRGYGFVEMDNAEEALGALNGQDFEGRPLKISEATGRKERK
ncbi:MAG: RNA-binding protein [Chitinispirillales bacterium]|jgi:RNA recognition motif-containing protein|nr:RNA-binding protein [Chitinispirillales bacterium]